MKPLAGRFFTTNTTNIGTNETIIGFDPSITVTNGSSFTISGTFTSSGTWTSTGGTWWDPDPDMTDWPPGDIIDYYAKELAGRRPA